ncbi:response regulator transcription factor [Chloroflexi bacterium TSY]|nr:response regulator transcription factor [Chloroflexi bacterium TSY]
MSKSESIRVIVVDDQRLVREGIATLLALEPDIEIVGRAVDGQEAVKLATELTPDLILMDVRMPIMTGIEATIEIRKRLPDCQILMLTTFNDDEYVVQSLKAGACGYLLKDIPSEDLAQAIRLAHTGIYQLDPAIAGALVGSLSTQPTSTQPTTEEIPLTQRELEVLRLLGEGATNREIADALIVSEGTVKKHISSILQTLHLRDRTQAAIYAIKHGVA